MVSPNLNRKSTNVYTLSNGVKRLFQVIYRNQNKDESGKSETPKIKVSELISKMAFYYEKIRNSVDYKEEYLLMKNAIERILRRQLIIEGVIKTSLSGEIAANLLIGLIRAGYLPNDKIPEEKIKEVGLIIEKYIKLRSYSLAEANSPAALNSRNNDKLAIKDNKNEITRWLIALAASEIEESLGRDEVQQVVIKNMYEILTKNIILPADLPYEKDLEIQIYLGIHRNFLRFDRDMLNYILFKYYNANWKTAKDEEIEKISRSLPSLQKAIDKQLNHPLKGQLNKIISRYNVYYTILLDIISDDPVGAYDLVRDDIAVFSAKIKNICAKKYKQIKSKLWRAAVRSIIYIFITKSIFAVLLEVPATKFFNEDLNPLSLTVNIVFPAFLLFLIVMFTRVPSGDNTNKIIEGIEEIVLAEKEKKEPLVLRRPIGRSKIANAFFGIFYAITFFLSFGAVVWALDRIYFNWVSIAIFLFFLAFVSFFSIRIRKSVKDLVIVEEKESLFKFVIDFFYIPIASAGKWLSERFSKINVFVFVLDFIIEAPFMIFIKIAEDWTKYVKERKEEIV